MNFFSLKTINESFLHNKLYDLKTLSTINNIIFKTVFVNDYDQLTVWRHISHKLNSYKGAKMFVLFLNVMPQTFIELCVKDTCTLRIIQYLGTFTHFFFFMLLLANLISSFSKMSISLPQFLTEIWRTWTNIYNARTKICFTWRSEYV